MSEEFSFKALKVLREEHTDDKNLIRLWIVCWGKGKPVLEKRRVWIDVDGTEKPRKMVGMNNDDLKYIINNQETITSILQGDAQ